MIWIRLRLSTINGTTTIRPVFNTRFLVNRMSLNSFIDVTRLVIFFGLLPEPKIDYVTGRVLGKTGVRGDILESE